MLAAGSRAAAAAARRRPSRRIRVLCWHAIDDFSGDPVLGPYGVPPRHFAGQLDLLARAGWVFVPPDELAALLREGAVVPPRALLLTFDDCYVDLLTNAVPLLRHRGVGALAFAISGAVGGWNRWDQAIGARSVRLLDRAGLLAVEQAGVEVGSHSATHRLLPTLSEPELARELVGSARALRDLGVSPVRYFAYPYGSYDHSTPEAVQQAGYVAAFTGDPGVVTPGCDPFRLPRIEILDRDLGWRLLAKVELPRATAAAGRAAGLGGRILRRLARRGERR